MQFSSMQPRTSLDLFGGSPIRSPIRYGGELVNVEDDSEDEFMAIPRKKRKKRSKSVPSQKVHQENMETIQSYGAISEWNTDEDISVIQRESEDYTKKQRNGRLSSQGRKKKDSFNPKLFNSQFNYSLDNPQSLYVRHTDYHKKQLLKLKKKFQEESLISYLIDQHHSLIQRNQKPSIQRSPSVSTSLVHHIAASDPYILSDASLRRKSKYLTKKPAHPKVRPNSAIPWNKDSRILSYGRVKKSTKKKKPVRIKLKKSNVPDRYSGPLSR